MIITSRMKTLQIGAVISIVEAKRHTKVLLVGNATFEEYWEANKDYLNPNFGYEGYLKKANERVFFYAIEDPQYEVNNDK